ncbi:hypothetical protein [Campylobacter porcelli]|uniref:Uncharacterized protein n=1 Tax=Campylobacter porcelli TaxID=1660073 RepID=A0A1X9SVN0_9BACT|nr:hypothetical protein [Campylobacter sp. RM6137]ARR00305.1 hypothetical protein CSUIS_0466 [Campylobacter sp. RM6137]
MALIENTIDIGSAIPAVARYRLGKALAMAGLKEHLQKYVSSVECEDHLLTIVFNHNLALMEFNADKEQFLARAREFYKRRSKAFKELDFIPKRIEARVIIPKKELRSNEQKSVKSRCNSTFKNNAKDPQIYALFEQFREAIKLKEKE